IDLTDNPTLYDSINDLYMRNMTIAQQHFDYKIKARLDGPFIRKSLVDFGKQTTTISGGAYGRVYKTDKNFAIKELKEDFLDSYGDINAPFIRETAIMRYLDHPNIINIDAMTFGPPIELVMPLARGTLNDVDLRPKLARQRTFYQ